MSDGINVTKVYLVKALEPICPSDEFLHRQTGFPAVPSARLQHALKRSMLNGMLKKIKILDQAKILVEGCCGEPDCPLCGTFGYAPNGRRSRAKAIFSDINPLFIPIGSVWGTSHEMISRAVDIGVIGRDEVRLKLPRDSFDIQGLHDGSLITLGWMPLRIGYPEPPIRDSALRRFVEMGIMGKEMPRVFLIPDHIMSHLLWDTPNCTPIEMFDVSTTNIIKKPVPLCGMIPPNSVLWFSVSYRKPADVLTTVENGICQLEEEGIGGYSERETGRLRLLNSQEVQP